jgi:secreted trypsin-like serine protease
MKSEYFALSSILLLFAIDSVASEGRIYGGYPINITDAPYMVHINVILERFSDGTATTYACGGTILMRNLILTAGHCKLKTLINFQITFFVIFMNRHKKFIN